jgi:hypothetical protein
MKIVKGKNEIKKKGIISKNLLDLIKKENIKGMQHE